MLNQRLEKLVGRDHKIGHSYFLAQEAWDWENYLRAFTDKIIPLLQEPLLQEYFYGDWGKMCLVLGKGFVTVNQPEDTADFFATLPESNELLIQEQLDELQQKETWKLENFSGTAEDPEKRFATALQLLSSKAVVSQSVAP